jgi:cell division protein FtsL
MKFVINILRAVGEFIGACIVGSLWLFLIIGFAILLSIGLVAPMFYVGERLAACENAVILKEHKAQLENRTLQVEEITTINNRRGDFRETEVRFSDDTRTTAIRYKTQTLPFRKGQTVRFSSRSIPDIKGGGECRSIRPEEWLEIIN